MSGAALRPGLLVLEPSQRGHGREWLLHLASGFRQDEGAPPLTFAVGPRMAERLRSDLADGTMSGPRVVALSDRETALCTHRRLAISGLARWSAMRRQLRETGHQHGLFLEFDHLSLPLALGLPLGPGRTVSGILFRPSVHYDPGNGRRPGERLREIRKNLLYGLTLSHPALRCVHTLDDAFPDFARRRYRHGWKVRALPDPVHPLVEISPADGRIADDVPAGRVLLVLFGVLTERKGVLALLRALAELDNASAARVAVIVAGEVDPSIAEEAGRAFAALPSAQPMLWCRLEARRLSVGEIAALIDRADVILAPYQRFVGSSGVLMWAAGRGRPVIAQDYGLVGRLVRDHRLGLAVDTTDPVALARAIACAASRPRGRLADPECMARFAEARTPAAFAAGILAGLGHLCDIR